MKLIKDRLTEIATVAAVVTGTLGFCGSALAVAPDCASNTIHCVGAGYEFNTARTTYVEEAFRDALAAARAGDTIAIAGGEYIRDSRSPNLNFMDVEKSGTAGAPIRIKGFDGERALIRGFGFPEGTAGPTRQNERLFRITGDYIELSNLELAYGSRYGVIVTGSNNLLSELIVRDAWQSNIVLMGTGARPARNNTIQYTQTLRSRHGSGIWVAIASQGKQPVIDTVIRYNIAHENGYQEDGQIVPSVPGDPAGGGNSDGIATFKSCHDDRALWDMSNACPGMQMYGNVVWDNTDDGINLNNGGPGTVVMENIAISNGPRGNKGFKLIRYTYGGMKFIGNLSIGNDSTGIEFRANGQATVLNNASIANNSHGMAVYIQESADVTIENNLNAFNTGSKDLIVSAEGQIDSNWSEKATGDPLLMAPSIAGVNFSLAYSASLSVAEKLEQIRKQVLDRFGTQSSSPLVDSGKYDPEVHCAKAPGVDVVASSTTRFCLGWKGLSPDIGPFEVEARSTGVKPKPPRLL